MMNDDKNKPTDSEENSSNEDKLPNINIRFDSFGDLIKDVDTDVINKFLDQNLDDKKLNNTQD